MKPIAGYDNYQISAFGNVLNIKTNKILKPYFNKRLGYYYITLSKEGVMKDFRLHRLVASAYLENKDNLPEVNHKSGNKLNNYFLNLEWCTSSWNRKHAYANGLQEKAREHCRRLGKRRVVEMSKPILQYNFKTGEFIKEYPSMRQAARELNLHQFDISNTVNKKQKYTHGFTFKLKSEN